MEPYWPESLAQVFWRLLRSHWIFVVWLCRIAGGGNKVMSFMVQSAEDDDFHFARQFQSQSDSRDECSDLILEFYQQWLCLSQSSTVFYFSLLPPALPCICIHSSYYTFVPLSSPSICISPTIFFFVLISLPFWIPYSSTSCLISPFYVVQSASSLTTCIIIAEVLRTE